MNLNYKIALIAVITGLSTFLTGCGALPAASSAALDAGSASKATEQKQDADQYHYRINTNFGKAYNTALMSASNMGRITYQDRESGLIQFQVGNWITNASITKEGDHANAALTFRYVPSSSFDFNSKKKLATAFIKGIAEAGLGVNPVHGSN